MKKINKLNNTKDLVPGVISATFQAPDCIKPLATILDSVATDNPITVESTLGHCRSMMIRDHYRPLPHALKKKELDCPLR